MKNLRDLQATIGHHFSNVRLLEQAMTHSSWANEQNGEVEHNERLEFLGDAVLELCVSEKLFTNFDHAREGELTRIRSRIVSKTGLEQLARNLGLEQYLHLGKGEESQGGRDRAALLSDAFEAMLGAVFLDAGYAAASGVVLRLLDKDIAAHYMPSYSKDHKSRLQEITQKLFKSRPLYTLLGSSGPEHAKRFDVKVALADGRVFIAGGPSMKRAEQMAAEQAVAALLPEEAAAEALLAEKKCADQKVLESSHVEKKAIKQSGNAPKKKSQHAAKAASATKSSGKSAGKQMLTRKKPSSEKN